MASFLLGFVCGAVSLAVFMIGLTWLCFSGGERDDDGEMMVVVAGDPSGREE